MSQPEWGVAVLRRVKYDPKSGELTWRPTENETWNEKYAGKPLARNQRNPRRPRVVVEMMTIAAVEVAWFLHYGKLPPGVIAKKPMYEEEKPRPTVRLVVRNGDPNDLKLGNMREIAVKQREKRGKWEKREKKETYTPLPGGKFRVDAKDGNAIHQEIFDDRRDAEHWVEQLKMGAINLPDKSKAIPRVRKTPERPPLAEEELQILLMLVEYREDEDTLYWKKREPRLFLPEGGPEAGHPDSETLCNRFNARFAGKAIRKRYIYLPSPVGKFSCSIAAAAWAIVHKRWPPHKLVRKDPRSTGISPKLFRVPKSA